MGVGKLVLLPVGFVLLVRFVGRGELVLLVRFEVRGEFVFPPAGVVDSGGSILPVGSVGPGELVVPVGSVGPGEVIVPVGSEGSGDTVGSLGIVGYGSPFLVLVTFKGRGVGVSELMVVFVTGIGGVPVLVIKEGVIGGGADGCVVSTRLSNIS